MKKVVILVILVMLLGTLFLLGCDDTRPDNWNIEEGKWKWEAWGEGVIVSVEKIRGSGCTHDDENEWCSEDYRIELDNGSSFTCGNIRNFGFITVGQKGILYKSARRSSDKYSWFQWIKDENYESHIVESRKIADIIKTSDITYIVSTPITESNIKNSETVYQWNEANRSSPPANTTVLVRLKSGIFTTAYILSNGNWKYDLYRNKTGGGLTTFNIVEWKKIDLE